jgi:hypothetical protein
MTKNEFVCDLNSCINVGFDVGTTAAKGAAFGGAVGAAAGAGLGLVKAAFSGDLNDCANGLIKVGGKMVKLAEKYAPKTVAFVKDAVTAIKQTPVYKKAKTVVTTAVATVKYAADYAYYGVTRYVAPIASYARDVARSAYNGVSRAYTSVKNTATQVYHSAKKTVSQAYTSVKSTVSRAYTSAKSTVSRAYTSVKKTATKVYSSAKKAVTGVACSVSSWFGFGCRRKRWRRNTPTFEYNASAVDPLFELLDDAGMLAAASKTVYDNADALFFNTSKGVPIDMGPLVHPDVEAKYQKQPHVGEQRTAAVFTESLAAYQTFAQKSVELDSRIETSRFMTENVAAYLLDEGYDQEDQVELALQLMRSRREETVFRVLEQASEMNTAYHYTSLKQKLDINLPDSPSLSDLQQLFGNFSESYLSASEPPMSTAWKRNEGTVYYTFNKSTSPDRFRDLNRTGSASFTLRLSGQSKYKDVRLVDESVAAYVYPIAAAKLDNSTATAAIVEISKGGYSSFLPTKIADSTPVTFLHASNSAETSFQYDPDTCSPVMVEPRSTAALLGTSPSGEWQITISESMREAFAPAVNLRMAFKVQWFESIAVADDEVAEHGAAMFENDPCDQPTCFLSATTEEPVVALAECNANGVDGSGKDFTPAATEVNGPNAGIIALVVCLSLLFAVGLAVFLIVRCQSKESEKIVLNSERSHHTVVNQVYDTSAGHDARCTSCSAKVKFCTCDVRRDTLSQPTQRRAQSGLPMPPPPDSANGLDADTKGKTVGWARPVDGTTGVKCTYVSKTTGSKCTRKRAPGELYCTTYHLCPTLGCSNMKPKAQLKCEDCQLQQQQQQQQQPTNVDDCVVQRSISGLHAFIIPLESETGEVGGPTYDQASGSAQPTYDHAHQDNSAVYYSQASGSAQPTYDHAHQDNSAVHYSQASETMQPHYDLANQSESANYSLATSTNPEQDPDTEA